MAILPEFVRFKNSCSGYDAGDEFAWGDIKAGIACMTGDVGNADIAVLAGLSVGDDAPSAKNFAFMPFFNGNIEAAF